MGIELKVKREDRHLDPKLMKRRDVLDVEGESKELILAIGRRLLMTSKKLDKRIYVNMYLIRDGVVDISKPHIVHDYVEGKPFYKIHCNKLKEAGLII